MPTLRVVREEDDGVVISGMKMLATGAVFANDIWIGNVIPLAPEQKKGSITCAIACNAPGLRLWSRKPMETGSSRSSIRCCPTATTRATACCCATRSRCRGNASSSTTTPSWRGDLHQDAEPLLRQSSIERALLVEVR